MGKRKVLNESALKEIRLAEEGEMYGRVIKLLGSDQVLVKCTDDITSCLLYTSPSPRDRTRSRMPSSA